MSEEIKKQEQDKKTNNQDYEIDLGRLFIGMGNKISGFFNNILNLIKLMFRTFLLLIIFIKKNIITIIIVSVISLISGITIDYFHKPNHTYKTSMTLSPNFGSTLQLYKSVEMFQSLIESQNYDLLYKKLNISKDEAQSLISFSVEPYISELDKVIAYKNFLLEADSSTAKNYSFDEYFKNIAVGDFKFHIINVVAKNNNVFSKLKDPIISSIVSNKYFTKIKETSYKNLLAKRENLNLSKTHLDSLRDFNKKILILNAKKEASGTNIFMAQNKIIQDKEFMVFNKYMILNEEILTINKDILNEVNLVDVVSDFNDVGSKSKLWYVNFSLLGLIGGFCLVTIILLMVELNKWLQKYIDKNIKE